ncbi:MAG: Rne/Rng family ribonuclease [Terracidiphilus sp.]|jgi:ribonuclease G
MAKEICISSTPHETRLAILEDDQLAEIYYERENEYTLAGSIYNGRVTRVLPGMQSAFVDVGLERDAFLYVTDFMELEDSEETDELEKAASTGANQPPREVRHTAGREPAQDRGGRPGPKPEQKQEPRQERPARDRQLTVEALPETETAPLPSSGSVSISEQDEAGEEGSGAPGAKRWRGRRRRRGGRGGGEATAGQPESGKAPAAYVEEITETEPEVAPQIHATGDRSSQTKSGTSAPAPASRGDRGPSSAPAPIVLPGESLSKYGGAPGESAQAADTPKTAAPARPESSFKPATLIVAPIRWDGSGLLPGESLSKHRNLQDEEYRPAGQAETEVRDAQADAPEAASFAPDVVEEQEFFEEVTESGPETASLPLAVSVEEMPATAAAEDYVVEEEPVEEEELVEEDEYEETIETAFDADDPELGESKPAVETWETESETSEPDASASHNVDPLPPTGFRLFGLGSKKKVEDKAAKPAAKSAAVSSYAPGSGLIEEETIEEEEFDAPRHAHRAKGGDHESDDFEEETLPNQLRTGDLGEMLQEAHLDHRIQMNFDEKNGDEESFDDEEEEEPAAGGKPAAGSPTQQRPDRNARGRRGRGGMATPGGQTGQTGQGGRGRGMSRRSMQTSDLPIISDLLKSGQEILVQIAKEPIAKKGARITSHIALPGRFLVFMPTVSHIGVSRKIASDEERQRLKRILVHERGEASGGFIVRTAAEGASEEELRTDLRMLLNLWAEIKKRSDESKSPALIYHDLGLIERILRDQISSNFSSIWVDSEADYERIVRFLNRFSPSLVRRVKLYTKETPLFEHFGIQEEITKALNSKVWLKSGGSIVINQTEALVAIDINTGKYVGKSARLEDTIVKTNLDAVPEIVRQIRLRDLGGIIVIDFIDMDDRKNRYKVMAALEEALKSDRAPTKVLQFNDFGLVAITRKRVKQSLERTLSVPCPTCQATGMVKSPTTVCNEIYTELRKMKKHFESADVLLRVNPETVKVLKANSGSWLTEFEELTGRNILIKSDATLHPEQFDIQG